jgi:AcrR family transcriptional regulator
MKERLTRAQKRERTFEGLISAAERLFVERGFHASTVDEIALEAGYTKGAVYSNFASKNGPAAGLELLASDAARRRGGADDGWLAVYFEFWAHVVRRPELRERFAKIHGRAAEPMTAAVERIAEERGFAMPVGARGINVAMIAMVSGLSLERLTQPDVVDVGLGARMVRLVLEDLGRDGVVRAREDRKE